MVSSGREARERRIHVDAGRPAADGLRGGGTAVRSGWAVFEPCIRRKTIRDDPSVERHTAGEQIGRHIRESLGHGLVVQRDRVSAGAEIPAADVEELEHDGFRRFREDVRMDHNRDVLARGAWREIQDSIGKRVVVAVACCRASTQAIADRDGSGRSSGDIDRHVVSADSFGGGTGGCGEGNGSTGEAIIVAQEHG